MPRIPARLEQIVQIVNDHQPHADGRVDLFPHRL